ncbi:MAG: tRNA (N6-isopentenyl adenosine(37)-C2)-methylthiotransferase MiaB [Bacilli bacterium]
MTRLVNNYKHKMLVNLTFYYGKILTCVIILMFLGSDKMQKPNMIEAQKRGHLKTKVLTNDYNIPSDMQSYGVNKKYYIETYGCQMNVHDSEAVKAILEDMAFTNTKDLSAADLIIINTCAIRENAHNKVFGKLGQLKNLKKNNPNIMIGLCGCMAQEEVVIDLLLKKYQWLDFVFGTHNIYKLPAILKEAITKKELVVEVWSKEGNIIENIPFKRDSKYKAWVNIMYGCDNFCTYCIVPYVRGRQRSRKPNYIMDEVQELIKAGYKEITLLGQNVNSYGRDFIDQNYDFADLLTDISKTDIDRIRFVTSNPWDFTDKMIEVIKNNKNIMPYIHLPIQSGSNKILKLMGRRYTKEDYIELFNKIKSNIKNVSISTDIIVGFPGETEEDFQETLALVNELKFDFAFTFVYSLREGTAAIKLKDNVSEDEKKERLYQLNKLINKYALANNQKYLLQTVKVLIEKQDVKTGLLMGYTETNKLTYCEGDLSDIGKIVLVKINKVKTWSLSGERVF